MEKAKEDSGNKLTLGTIREVTKTKLIKTEPPELHHSVT
jgi:hypothetical protein